MKRIFPLVLTAMLLLAACQATPEAEVVPQKDTDRMIEQALATPSHSPSSSPELTNAQAAIADTTSTPPVSALYERLGIPQSYQDTLSNERGKLTVNINAEIVVPQVGVLPVARVVPANFSQELVTAMYDYLVGDTPMFERVMEMDKVQLEHEILRLKQSLADPNNKWSEANENDLKRLENLYPQAPDKHIPVPAGPTLKNEMVNYEETDVLNGERTRLDIVSDIYGGGLEFIVSNNTEYENADTYFYKDDEGNTQYFVPESGASFSFYRSHEQDKMGLIRTRGAYPYVNATYESLHGGILAEATLISVTPMEAREQAQDFLDAIGADYMSIDEVTLMSSIDRDFPAWAMLKYESEQAWLDAGSPAPPKEASERMGYEVSCRRSLNGATVAGDIDSTTKDGTAYSAEWRNERLFIAVDDEGISAVIWIAPLEVSEIITADATLKSFNEISEIIEKMLFAMYESNNISRINVEKIRLSLQRISEQDSFESGILVPVWNVYGSSSRYVTHDDGQTYQWTNARAHLLPLITVNAIDGSIIDLQQGY